MRLLTLSLALLLACCSQLVESTESGSGGESICAAKADPHLVVSTPEGEIVAELFEAAAPNAVQQLASLLSEGDYYDGLTFNEARPHVEIVTADRGPENLVEIPNEIDARALGLDRQKIENAGKAMDQAQRELAPAYKRKLKTGSLTPRLKEWMDELRSTHDAAFLVGVSQEEINEALGYAYQDGLESQPVTRGALMLKPLSPRVASARLSIALTDMPQRTGRWMVVGRVVEGLETAQAISARPLADPATVQSRTQPRSPVLIESIRLDCR